MNGSIGFKVALVHDSDFFVAALYDTTDVGTVLESIQVPKGSGYLPQFQVTFTYNLLQDKVYRCILWESPDATPTGINVVSDDFKASLNSITLRGKLYLTADISAGLASGTTSYIDPGSTLFGWIYNLEQIGYGTLEDGVGKDYTLDPDTNNWTLVNGSTIYNLQKFVLHFQPQISAAPQPSVSLITSGEIITANTTLTGAKKNKALILQGAGSSLVVDLPLLSSLADFDQVITYSFGGNHINAVLPCQGSDKIQWFVNGSTKTVSRIVLGQNENLKLFKFTVAGTAYYWVDFVSPGVSQVGEVMDKYSFGDVNTLFLDGAITGTLPLRADYPRLYAYMNTLDSSAIVSEADWASTTVLNGVTYFQNMGKWTQGNGTTTFRPPRLFTAGFLRAVNGTTRKAGDFEADAIGTFPAQITGKILAKSGNSNRVIVVGNISDADLGTAQGQVITITGNSTDHTTHPMDVAIYKSIRI